MVFRSSLPRLSNARLLLLVLVIISQYPATLAGQTANSTQISSSAYHNLATAKVGDWARQLETFHESPDRMTQISREIVVNKTEKAVTCKTELPFPGPAGESRYQEFPLDKQVKPVIKPGDSVREETVFLNGVKHTCKVITQREPKRNEGGKVVSREAVLWLSPKIPVSGIYLFELWRTTYLEDGSESRRLTYSNQVVEVGHDDIQKQSDKQ